MTKLIEKLVSTLLPPMSGWDVLKEEAISERDLIRDFLVYTAAVPTISGFLGLIFKGENFFRALIWAVLFYGAAVGGIYLFARVLAYLASSFSAEENEQTYLKLAIFSSAPMFIACVFFLIPPIYGLSLIGLYGFLQFWIGYDRIVLVPKEEKLNFFFLSLIVFVLTLILIFLIPALLAQTAVYYAWIA